VTIFFQTNTIRDIFKNILALPSFIMVVNGCVLKPKINASIHHKYNPYSSRELLKAFWSEVVFFCEKNIHINDFMKKNN